MGRGWVFHQDNDPKHACKLVKKWFQIKKVSIVKRPAQSPDLSHIQQLQDEDPNQLIRASALRVLSSIRVAMIAPIMMLAIKESVRDMSPYVRKVAAHAIPKLYALDPDQKGELVDAIDFLLADKTTLVIGSAVYAFEEICPERIDLIHKHYRKLCQVMADVDEWGQVMIINLMTRYARTQFTDPNLGEMDSEKEETFFSSDEESDDEGDSDDSAKKRKAQQKKKKEKESKPKPYLMDPDLRMLLKNTKPLLQSRNSSVVLAVAQLYYHLAPRNEISVIAKALVRLLRGHREVQSVVLMNIATISAKKRVFQSLYAISKNMFEPFLKSFFIRSSDPTHIKLLKLEVLTNLATQTNIQMILREFQTYVYTHDKELTVAAIEAIGRCAVNIKEVTDVCLSGLVALMASKNEIVVAQSVVVIKRLLQIQPSAHKDIIMSMTKLIDTVKVPGARASIVWLIGEYCQTVPLIAPDVLRKMAKTFVQEEDVVKLQILNMAVKLLLTNREQSLPLVQYVFQLAKYDQSYDLRDRARFLRNLVMPQQENRLTQFAAKMFLTPKPAPVLESTFKDRDQFQLGTLSHYLNQRCAGYSDLPHFPEVAPDGKVRDVAGFGIPVPNEKSSAPQAASAASTRHSSKKSKKAETFYSDDESEGEKESEEASSGSESSSEEEESEESEEGSEESDDEEEEESSAESSEEDEDEDDEEEESSEEEPPKKPPPKSATSKKERKVEPTNKPSLDLLLDLDFGAPSGGNSSAQPPLSTGPTLLPSAAGSVSSAPKAPTLSKSYEVIHTAPAQFVPKRSSELLNKVAGQGLSVDYRFTRSPSLFSNKMCAIELRFENHSAIPFESIKLVDKKLPVGLSVSGFDDSVALAPGKSVSVMLGVDFADTTQDAVLSVEVSQSDESGPRRLTLTIQAPVGEQLEPVLLSQQQFKAEQSKLSGLNETSGKFKSSIAIDDVKAIVAKVYDLANVIQVEGIDSADKICFSGRTLSNKALLLITFSKTGEELKLAVNCEKMVIGSMLFKHIKQSLAV
uniref:AP-3 complex subunit beta n=1 Tax=Plectus sambesii TaxID=2011161 RepID=A0A914WCZ3_9BILA